MPDLKTLRTRAGDAVLFAAIDNPPMNLLGPELVADLVPLIELNDRGDRYRVVVFSSTDPDFFIPHVDLTKDAEYRRAEAKPSGEASIGLLFRRLGETRAVTIAETAGHVRGVGAHTSLTRPRTTP
jgi:enoyl-CoA hydratase/carnithine racemase